MEQAVGRRAQEAHDRADQLNRRLAAHEVSLRREDLEEVRVVVRTPSYARSDPRVSVLIPLYDHAQEVRAALASVASSEYEAVEVVVLDDASNDHSRDVVLDFLAEHRHPPGILLQHVVNRGLGRTRNDLVDAARGELVFMLDADNEIYPTALERLVEALDADPKVFFAYPMLEEHIDGGPHTLGSFLPWEPGRLSESDYIDAMSLLRRRDLLELGAHRGPALARVGGLRPLAPDRRPRAPRCPRPRGARALSPRRPLDCSTRSRTSTPHPRPTGRPGRALALAPQVTAKRARASSSSNAPEKR